MEKFLGKYRIPSTRLQNWDYSSNAGYFVTLCTANRVHSFGEIVDGGMLYNALGLCAIQCWQAIPEHFPFVVLGAYVVMPNHVHGIVIIDKPIVETQDFASLPQSPPQTGKFGPQSQNLGAIVRGFKIGVTKFANQNNLPLKWQTRFYDHIIRDATDHAHIHAYILNNPAAWEKDRFHTPS